MCSIALYLLLVWLGVHASVDTRPVIRSGPWIRCVGVFNADAAMPRAGRRSCFESWTDAAMPRAAVNTSSNSWTDASMPCAGVDSSFESWTRVAGAGAGLDDSWAGNSSPADTAGLDAGFGYTATCGDTSPCDARSSIIRDASLHMRSGGDATPSVCVVGKAVSHFSNKSMSSVHEAVSYCGNDRFEKIGKAVYSSKLLGMTSDALPVGWARVCTPLTATGACTPLTATGACTPLTATGSCALLEESVYAASADGHTEHGSKGAFGSHPRAVGTREHAKGQSASAMALDAEVNDRSCIRLQPYASTPRASTAAVVCSKLKGACADPKRAVQPRESQP